MKFITHTCTYDIQNFKWCILSEQTNISKGDVLILSNILEGNSFISCLHALEDYKLPELKCIMLNCTPADES